MYKRYFDYVTEHRHLPVMSFFTNHPEEQVRYRAAILLQRREDISHNWKEKYGIDMLHGDENYLHDVESSLGYFELKKVKIMQADIQQLLQQEKDESRLLTLIGQFLGLKKTEQEILSRPGTVIVKTVSRQ